MTLHPSPTAPRSGPAPGGDRLRRARLWLPAALALLAVVGCSRQSTPFRVARCDPGSGSLVALNQDLWITFSRYPDPNTVNDRTIRVLDGAGNTVPGRFEVVGKFVVFRPRPPLHKELDDGGFKPGARYTLEIPGFPRLSTIRSREPDGTSLHESFRMEFTTTRSDGEGHVPLLMDPESPRQGSWPRLHEALLGTPQLPVVRVAPGLNPRITFSEPLDPRSVTPVGPFALSTLLENRPIPLDDVRLVAKGVTLEELGRVVEVVPSEPLQPGLEYRLRIRPGPWLLDYGGNRLCLGQQAGGDSLWVLVKVDPRRGEEFFISRNDCDAETARGEAWGWWGEGQLSVALLPEAGRADLGYLMPTGDLVVEPGRPVHCGNRILFHCPPDRDLSFSRIRIPEDVTLRLKGPGPWIIRSQGPVDIQGRIQVDPAGGGGRPPRRGTYVTPEWLVGNRVRQADLLLVTSGNLGLDGTIHAPGGGVTLASGGQVLLGELARVEATWLERADRNTRGRVPQGLGCTTVITGLTPDRKRSGWVSEPMEVGAISTFRELPAGPGLLAQPVITAVGAQDLKVHLQGAPADPEAPGRPDLTRVTPWFYHTDMGFLQGCRFFRFRIRFTVPAGREPSPPRITAFILRRK